MKIKYEQLFPTASFLNCRIGFETDIPDDGNVDAELTTLKDLATAFHMKEFPQFYKQNKPIYNGEEQQQEIQVKEPEPKLTKEEKQKKCITDTVSLDGPDGLLSFAFLVSNNPHLQETYDTHLKKLTDGLQ